jgi:hypothetical protein
MIEFLDDEFAFVEAFVCDVEDRVFVGGFVVHVEDDVGLRDGDDMGDVFGFGPDAIFADGDVHVGGVLFKHLKRAERLQVLDALRFECIAIVAFEGSRGEVVFGDARIILFGFDNFTRQLNSFILLVLKSVDIDHATMYEHAHCIAIRSVWVGSINVAF